MDNLCSFRFIKKKNVYDTPFVHKIKSVFKSSDFLMLLILNGNVLSFMAELLRLKYK